MLTNDWRSFQNSFFSPFSDHQCLIILPSYFGEGKESDKNIERGKIGRQISWFSQEQHDHCLSQFKGVEKQVVDF